MAKKDEIVSSNVSISLTAEELKALLKQARKKENKDATMTIATSGGSGIGISMSVSFNDNPKVDITDYGIW